MYKLNPHASRDRLERMMFLSMEIGLGDEICHLTREKDNYKEVLTSTGLILIIDEFNYLITAYVANLDKAFAIWRNVKGSAKMPNALYKKIIRNKENYSISQEISIQNNYHNGIDKQYKFRNKKAHRRFE